jgi:hypothetical protein
MRRLLLVTVASLLACATEIKAPTASAGADRSVLIGSVVHLDAAASSDPAGTPLTYEWTLVGLPAGSAAKLNAATVANPSFTADVAGDYVVQLAVSNGVKRSAPDQVTITATGAVVASAGPSRRVPIGQVVALDGSASSVPGTLTPQYAWSFRSLPPASAAVINNPHVASPTFTADVAGAFVVDLVVSNGVGALATASATITADATVGVVTPQPAFSASVLAIGGAVGLAAPRGIAVDDTGAVYVAESGGTPRVTRHAAGASAVYSQRAFLNAGPQDLAWLGGGLVATVGGQRIVTIDAAGLQGAAVDTSNANGESFWGLSVTGTGVAQRLITGSRSNNGVVYAFDPAAWTNTPGTAATYTNGIANPNQAWGAASYTPTVGTTVYFLAAGNEVWRSAGVTGTRIMRAGLLAGARKLLLTSCPTPRLLVASRDNGSVLALDPACTTTDCAYVTAKAVVAGLGTPTGLAWSGADLLVTDESLNAVFKITGDFCSL